MKLLWVQAESLLFLTLAAAGCSAVIDLRLCVIDSRSNRPILGTIVRMRPE
jgi:hypothetical protein